MQPIERYGVVALVFLVVTVVAVLLWDSGEGKGSVAEAAVAPNVAGPGSSTSLVALPPKRSRALRRDEELQADPVPSVTPAETRAAATEAAPQAETRPLQGPGADLAGVPQDRTYAGSEPAVSPEAPAARPPAVSSTVVRNAAPANAPSPRPAASGSHHVVAAGDTLGEISLQRLGSSKRWKEIVDLNPGLDPARLRVGARLRLPDGAKSAGESQASPSAAASTRTGAPAGGGATYVVRPGDSLWKIALATLGDGERWREIRDANPSVDASRLAVGQRLVLPAGARPVDTTAPTVARADTTATQRGKVR